MGWVDRDALWCFDVPGRKVRCLPLNTGSDFLTIHPGGLERFSLTHDFKGSRFELTVHDFSDPSWVAARATFTNADNKVTGDLLQWEGVPLWYVHYLSLWPWNDFVLLKISPASGRVEPQRLGWYDHTYDKGYQGVTGVLELPGENFALISVGRSSEVVLHDLESGTRKGTINLGGRGGNPTLRLGKTGQEIWATDYDTIAVIDRQDLRVLRTSRLQNSIDGTRKFIGDY